MERLRSEDSKLALSVETCFHEPVPHFWIISSTSCFTLLLFVTCGPKLNASQKVATFSADELNNFSPSRRYPLSGSSTCCQGRVELGFRTAIGELFCRSRIQSGTIRFLLQSPPPITLPARAEAIRTP